MFFFKVRKKPDFDILIVDDEKDFLDSMEVWFESQGYSVEAVTSGEQALKLLGEKTPGIIFLDVRMPQMNGIETLKKIRQSNPRIPVVIITALATEELRLASYKLGVNAFFEKSLDFYKAEHLVNSLVRVVSKRKA